MRQRGGGAICPSACRAPGRAGWKPCALSSLAHRHSTRAVSAAPGPAAGIGSAGPPSVEHARRRDAACACSGRWARCGLRARLWQSHPRAAHPFIAAPSTRAAGARAASPLSRLHLHPSASHLLCVACTRSAPAHTDVSPAPARPACPSEPSPPSPASCASASSSTSASPSAAAPPSATPTGACAPSQSAAGAEPAYAVCCKREQSGRALAGAETCCCWRRPCRGRGASRAGRRTGGQQRAASAHAAVRLCCACRAAHRCPAALACCAFVDRAAAHPRELPCSLPSAPRRYGVHVPSVKRRDTFYEKLQSDKQ